MTTYRSATKIVSVKEARAQFSELMAKVAHGAERVIVQRRGRPWVALISVEDLRKLETMEDEVEARRATRIRALAAAATVREEILAERCGEPLPDSADIIAMLREERLDEIAGLR
ncbi:MAG: type II toxin-antitoxin system prevent-host-death family antitoxin [Caldilineales bacterium]|nr:type II toxin-antitoxin system prevent-host-death family antitoxin [Caldilineales bacterium]MDW8318346.1 type II toxin-antitoxin system prevent-host-death family antitoxin [Anaerolineae bacterium]